MNSLNRGLKKRGDKLLTIDFLNYCVENTRIYKQWFSKMLSYELRDELFLFYQTTSGTFRHTDDLLSVPFAIRGRVFWRPLFVEAPAHSNHCVQYRLDLRGV